MAVSAESMIASAPSKIAVETSETSARVGRRCVTIDSSIWVATITGSFAPRACRMISFWIWGTSSSGTSTPRSPRATMTASTTLRMPGRLARISWRSSFATIGRSAAAACRRKPRTSWMSSADRTKETATRSTPCPRPKRRSSRSFSVRQDTGSVMRGSDNPLWSLTRPPTTTRHRTSSGDVASTRSWIIPSSIQISSSGRRSFRYSGWVIDARSAVPTTGRAESVKAWPAARSTRPPAVPNVPSLIFGPWRSCRMATGRPQRASPSRSRRMTSACSSWVP